MLPEKNGAREPKFFFFDWVFDRNLGPLWKRAHYPKILKICPDMVSKKVITNWDFFCFKKGFTTNWDFFTTNRALLSDYYKIGLFYRMGSYNDNSNEKRIRR